MIQAKAAESLPCPPLKKQGTEILDLMSRCLKLPSNKLDSCKIVIEFMLILTIRLSSQAKGQQFTQEVRCNPINLVFYFHWWQSCLRDCSGAFEARRPGIWATPRRHQDCCQGEECPPGVKP